MVNLVSIETTTQESTGLALCERQRVTFDLDSGHEVIEGINGYPDPFALAYPVLLDLGIMGHCENRCDFCYQGDRKEPHMSIRLFKKILNPAMCQYVNQVALGGRGDPNHHPNFEEMVRWCRDHDVVVNYTTSGRGLTQGQVNISTLCGAVAVSDYQRPYTYEAIRTFTKYGVRTNVHIVYTKHSHKRCVNILKGWYPQEWDFPVEKLNAIIFLLFKPQGRGRDLDWKPTGDQLKEFSELVFHHGTPVRIGMDSCLSHYALQYGNPDSLQKKMVGGCDAGRFSAYIDPRGRMRPCSFMDEGTGEGLWPQNTFEQVWWGGLSFRAVRKNLEHHPRKCPIGL